MDNNQEQFIEATEDSIKILQQQSHEFHTLFEEVMNTYGKTEQKLRDDLLRFTEKIIQTIGIFAGFGFTGIQGVKSIYLFAFGETLLIAAILYGIAKVKNIHATSLESVQKSFDKKFSVFNKKSLIFQRAIPTFLKDKKLDITKLQNEIEEADKEILIAFEEKPTPVNKNEGNFLNRIISLAIVGAILLLISFTNIPNLLLHIFLTKNFC